MKELIRIIIFLSFISILLSSKIGFVLGLLLLTLSFFRLVNFSLSQFINQSTDIIYRKLSFKSK